MPLVGVVVDAVAAGGDGWGGGVRPHAEGRMVLCLEHSGDRSAHDVCARCI